MSRSWCLVIALLSGVAVTAAVFDTAATAGPPAYSPKARVPRPPKTCTPDSFQREECIGRTLLRCTYERMENCNTRKTGCKKIGLCAS
jgi:hypothetical protein